MNILSIQSHVVFGHVGNAAAVFPMQRLGVEVWPLHTVQFSNHTGYGSWKGRVFDGFFVDELLEGLAQREILHTCDGVVSGYMGSPDLGYAILGAVGEVKKANPKALYCCDPVIGDVGRGIFVRQGIPEFMAEHACRVADIMTPNHFELEYLTHQSVHTKESLKSAIEALHAKGPRIVLVTSVHLDDTPHDALDLVVSEKGQCWRVRTPKLNITLSGTGDTITALFFVHYLRTRCIKTALCNATSSIYGLLKKTECASSREILLIFAQEEIVSPSCYFDAVPL
ncbi:pyridoxal kinase PdxY [Sulfurospirillum deleyianum]|uniref:pyridoxal kinase n=1 Tax=Sulfurospirillum deleyianum (strain ATCC 51133 / DSM 6946 / 5175) TaxID=525898 RepID=D1AZ14_SULD5|nr:pyridoxal kinase PdxY [Sulfurospirillum deleyianum]ACZ11152.1 pyridoxal kinase [Sulfurospirillum deleyianum DSM 6946]